MSKHVGITKDCNNKNIVQSKHTANVNNMGTHTVSTEHVTSMYCNVCLMMVTCNRNM
jgi:hypothetical protein